MKVFFTKLYKALMLISLGIMIIASVYFLVKIWALPNEIGVHFDGDGQFDVIANKWFGLYPFVVGYGTWLLMKLFSILSGKIKSGFKVNENGDEMLKLSFRLLASVIAFCVCIFFSYWALCVLNQICLNPVIGGIFAYIIIFAFLIFLLSIVVIRIKNSAKSK